MHSEWCIAKYFTELLNDYVIFEGMPVAVVGITIGVFSLDEYEANRGLV